MVKKYVLDTNILMATEGRAIYGFDDNIVVVPAVVLEELDNLKTRPGEVGYQARESVRIIDSITERSCGLRNWNIPDHKGTFEIVDLSDFGEELAHLPKGYSTSKADNIIIATALLIKKDELEKHNPEPVLVTNDAAMRVKALSCDLNTQSYRNDQISCDFSYTGRATIETDRSIETLYSTGVMDPPPFPDLSYGDEARPLKEQRYHEHEYYCLKNGSASALCKYEKGRLVKLTDYTKEPVFGISPKNSAQSFALDALLTPAEEVPLVLLKGPAGTGKTLLALAAALSQTYTSFGKRRHSEGGYDRIICARANVLADADIGFLPGDIQEKTLPLLSPVMDNLSYLLGLGEEDKEQVAIHMDSLLEDGIIEVTSLAYIRGRSLPNTFMIIDESQNLSRLQSKTILTRAGMGTKIVFMGDVDQIDNPKLDRKSCGLSYLSERFVDNPLCAQVEFFESESVRSKLAAEAIRLL